MGFSWALIALLIRDAKINSSRANNNNDNIDCANVLHQSPPGKQPSCLILIYFTVEKTNNRVD